MDTPNPATAVIKVQKFIILFVGSGTNCDVTLNRQLHIGQLHNKTLLALYLTYKSFRRGQCNIGSWRSWIFSSCYLFPQITTLFGSHTFNKWDETGLSIPQFGITEFGINISSIAKRTRDTQHFFEREYFTQHFIKYAFLTFLKRCEEEGVCRSFVSKNFPYPYPNQL